MRSRVSSKNPYQYFSVASDILVIRRGPSHVLDVLLIQRKYPPHQGSWALPGGFVDRHENALTAAKRELREETRLKGKKFVEFGTFSDPHRDPRGRTLSVSYYTVYTASYGTPRGCDDASHVEWFPLRKLPRLAFDHKQMIAKGIARFRHDLKCKRL